MLIESMAQIDDQVADIRRAAGKTIAWLLAQSEEPLELLRRMKFEAVGWHPVDGHELNVIEQVNQTWTYLAALAAAKELLQLHPQAGGFRISPGAHAAQSLDVMSVAPGMVGVETFAAVHPGNNRKLAMDLAKLAGCTETFRYVFFISPAYPGTQRRPQLERDGIQVWSVGID